MTAEHRHMWERGECRTCHVQRCDRVNTGGWRCTIAAAHLAQHHYADGSQGDTP